MNTDLLSEVYNALADIVAGTGADKKEMDAAIEWFQIHFWEEDDDE